MSTSIEEQKDLDALHAAQTAEREAFSYRCDHFLDMDETMLKYSGHKSIETALLYTTRDHRKKMRKIIAAHIAKWPD